MWFDRSRMILEYRCNYISFSPFPKYINLFTENRAISYHPVFEAPWEVTLSRFFRV